MIHISDLHPSAQIQLASGSLFTIETIEFRGNDKFVVSTLNNGSVGNYRTAINDSVLFFNENKSILL